MSKFIDFGVAPYALPDVLEALWLNGVTNGFVTKEDGDLHIRWEYKPGRKFDSKDDGTYSRNNDGINSTQ